jgi:transcriptional regulator with XRE-family HTH domain
MSFGEQIEKALQNTNETDLRFSNAADISPTTLRKIKRSDRSLTIVTLDKVAAKLNMEVVIKVVPKSKA